MRKTNPAAKFPFNAAGLVAITTNGVNASIGAITHQNECPVSCKRREAPGGRGDAGPNRYGDPAPTAPGWSAGKP
jgi:hypothetical protein